jgi:hypothetical protein
VRRLSIRSILTSDGFLACSVAVVAFSVYLRTLLPDVGGPEDTSKFQYLGAVLGTAHPPGYPLHTLLSHAFSYLPVGTVAYRANPLSAVLGAGTVFVAVLIGRTTGSGRAAAATGALVLAFGAGFWNYSVLAEVYTLGALLLVLVAYWLLRWAATRRNSHLFAAAFCFALALGNHLSIAAIAPAVLAFLIVTDWRRAFRPRTFLGAAAIVASGFLQYLYILQRTRSGSPFREASAANLEQLVNVVRATHFQEHIFAFSVKELLTTRLAELGALLKAELGVAGVCLAILGGVILFRRDWRAALFSCFSFACLCAFVLNLGGDLRGFLVVPLALVPPAIAAGADLVRDVIPRAGRLRLQTVAAVGLLLYPASMVWANYRANDWHRRTGDARFFRALFRHLPERAALLTEDYIADSIVSYMQAAEGGHKTRTLLQPGGDPESVRRLIPSGIPIFALDARHSELAPRGFHFKPVELFRPSQLVRLFAEELPRRSAHRLIGTFPDIGFGDTAWHDVTAALVDGSVSLLIDNRAPFDARVVLYAASAEPLRPMLQPTHRFGQGEPSFTVRQFDLEQPRHREALQALLAADGVTEPLSAAADRHLTRIEQVVNDNGQFAAWAIAFRGTPRKVLAMARPDHPHVRRAIATGVPPERFFEQHSIEEIAIADAGERWFGAGWHSAERGSDGGFRWTAARDAWLWMPSEVPGPVTLTVSAFGGPGSSLHAVVNGRELEACHLTTGSAHCTWTLPALDFKVGANAVALRSSSLTRPADSNPSADDRILGVAVTRIQLRR